MNKKIKNSLGSYKNDKGEQKCNVDEVAEKIYGIFELPFSNRVPFVICNELRMLAQAYMHYKSEYLKLKEQNKTLDQICKISLT